jgi:hypothetical protein
VAIQARLDVLAERMESSWETHELLTIRAWLASPIAFDVIGRMPLDDILCVASLRWLGISIDDLGPMDPEPVRIPAPLEQRGVGADWYYATSWARHFDPISMVRCKRKHFHESRFVEPKVVDTRSGKCRSYDLKTQAVATPFVEWTVSGDREWLRKLLPLIGSLGKDRNTGLGTVISWEISESDRDPCIVDGVPQRAIPCADGDVSAYAPGTFALAHRTVRPPYSWPGGRTKCVIPSGGANES